jgi:hypothetical protein
VNGQIAMGASWLTGETAIKDLIMRKIGVQEALAGLRLQAYQCDSAWT